MLLEQVTARLEKRCLDGELRIIEDYKISSKTEGLREPVLIPNKVIDFASNDYLSFATDQNEGEKYIQRLQELGRPALGSTGSRAASGNSAQHVALENRLAKIHNADAALLFNSGYDANSSVWTYLPQPGDVILFDELVHASIHEGMKLSRASLKLPFDHNSEPKMRRHLLELAQIEKVKKGQVNVFIAIESLYSMDGDLSPLKDMVESIKELFPAGNGYVVIDEAHSTGIYGMQGRGYVCELELEAECFIRVHTFGKAPGCNGAVVFCPDIIRTYLINYAASFRFSTAMPFSTVMAIEQSYDFQCSSKHETLVKHLFDLSAYLQTALMAHGQVLMTSKMTRSPIVPVKMPNPRPLALWLKGRGFAVVPLTFPDVPRGTERLRVSVHAGNTYEEADSLVSALTSWKVLQDLPFEEGLQLKARL